MLADHSNEEGEIPLVEETESFCGMADGTEEAVCRSLFLFGMGADIEAYSVRPRRSAARNADGGNIVRASRYG